MSGFDLPSIRGFDSSFKLPQGPMQSPEVFKIPDLGPVGNDGPDGLSVGGGKPFEGVLADSLQSVSNLQADVRGKVRGMVMGEDVELHDVMIAGSKAEVAFNLLLEVRNKMVDAWEKLSRSSG
jgi:flagellar hook-basal body complex protein FliE